MEEKTHKIEKSAKGKLSSPKKSYERKLPKKWLKDPNYSQWLSRSNKNKNKAYCNFCNSEMTGNIAVVERHMKTTRHITNANNTETFCNFGDSSIFAVSFVTLLPFRRMFQNGGALRH